MIRLCTDGFRLECISHRLGQLQPLRRLRGAAGYIFSGILKPVSGREVIKRLQAAGWKEARISGSHHILQKDGKSVPVPVHAGRDLGIGLIRKIERQTGVKFT